MLRYVHADLHNYRGCHHPAVKPSGPLAKVLGIKSIHVGDDLTTRASVLSGLF